MPYTANVSPEVERRLRSLDELEAKITELWGYLNAATARFLALVAEFDREQAYARHGLANTAQWLNWQCGIGVATAREKVRVARALEQLPEIADSFSKGEISYSKVRAMTRTATPANESVLLHVALHGTAVHVEKLVRKYRWTQRRDAADESQRQHEHRNVSSFFDVDGEFILHARLPREIGAVVRKALEVAVEAVRESKDVSAETPLQVPANAWHADALRLIAECFLQSHGEEAAGGSAADRVQIVVHIDQAILAEQQAATESGTPHRCELEDGPALALDTARRLACDATVVGIVEDEDGHPLDIGRKTRSIPPALGRALKSRDGGCCYPGCDRRRFTQGHHVKHWANGGETKLDNLITLCGFHHRLVHEGGYGLAAHRRWSLRLHAAGWNTRGASRRTTFQRKRRTHPAESPAHAGAGARYHHGYGSLPMARRNHGLQPGDRGDAVSAKQSRATAAVVTRLMPWSILHRRPL